MVALVGCTQTGNAFKDIKELIGGTDSVERAGMPGSADAPGGDAANTGQRATEEVSERLEAIYADVFGWYSRLRDDFSLTEKMPDFEKKYMTDDYNKWYDKVEQIDEPKSENGEMGFFDYDHWVCGQDFQDLSMRIVSVSSAAENSALAVVAISNCGTEQELTLPMVRERGDWFIDNFILKYEAAEPGAPEATAHTFDEKAEMKDYVAHGGGH